MTPGISGRRPLLVGELNPFGDDPDMALYPLPEHCSGGRLARILGLSRGEYLQAFDRVNLCAGKWNLRTASDRAFEVFRDSASAAVILLGVKVARAFERAALIQANPQPFQKYFSWGRPVVNLPHPSGLNRVWNDPQAEQKARSLVRPLIGRSP